jgi:hypothetical protein
LNANASRHKAMSYGHMIEDSARLEEEIERLLKQAEEMDADQDATLGSRRGDELPAELKRREDRLVSIRTSRRADRSTPPVFCCQLEVDGQ